jgi:FMN phosphatase YigB (HAD superfamily)
MKTMTVMHAELRRRGVPTFIFSNTNDLAIRHVRAHFPFFANFDGFVLSYEHGAMKPHAPLYEAVERLSGRRGAELLYIDDRPENIEAGRARGWQVILQEHPEKTIAGVRWGEVEGSPKLETRNAKRPLTRLPLALAQLSFAPLDFIGEQFLG